MGWGKEEEQDENEQREEEKEQNILFTSLYMPHHHPPGPIRWLQQLHMHFIKIMLQWKYRMSAFLVYVN